MKVIIEVDGLQHKKQTGFGDLDDIIKNDKHKYDIAINNGITKYIRIDASYSKFDYIKDSIFNSEISNIFNLEKIDWRKCELDSVRKEFVLLCKYWENVKHLDYEDAFDVLSKLFCYTKISIPKLLLKGAKIGLCDYKSKNITTKRNNSQTIPVYLTVNDSVVGYYVSVSEALDFILRNYNDNFERKYAYNKSLTGRCIKGANNTYKIIRISWEEYNSNQSTN